MKIDKDIFKENKQHNEEMFQKLKESNKVFEKYNNFEELYVDILGTNIVNIFQDKYKDEWQIAYAEYMQKNGKRFDYIFNSSLKQYNSYSELCEDIAKTCSKEFQKEDNKELFSRLEKLLEKNPQFKNSLNEFCTVCEKNPGKAFEMTSKLGGFATMIAKAYLRYCIHEIMHAQHQR